MKKLLLALAIVVSGLAIAQYYPNNGNQYPNNNGYYGNNGYYDDDYYFPEDYYYDYPNDYYAESYYRSYYEDYRRSIYSVDWNRFFRMHRLSRYQVQQIMWLNDLYPTYRSWLYQYQYNPDRWYYDRFYALERILGRRIYASYYQHYYRHHPVVYFQIHRNNYYIPKYKISSRYRHKDVRVFREDAFRNNAFRRQYEKDISNVNPNPRIMEDGFRKGDGRNNGISQNNGGFRNPQNTPPEQNPNNGGFRNQGTNGSNNDGVRNNGGFRTNESSGNDDGVRNGGYRNQQSTTGNGGFRNTGGFRSQENNDRREVERNPETSERRSQSEERRSSSRESSDSGESRNSGFRSGTR